MWLRSTICLFALALTAGCGDGLEKFPTAPVTGTVMCEGQPVPYAMVYFEPIASGSNVMVGKPAFALADEQGRFVLGTYSQDDGAVIGKHRVRVDPPPPGKNPEGWSCPCEMDSNKDVMQVEVTDGDNTFEVVLAKKAAAKPAVSEEDEEEKMDQDK